MATPPHPASLSLRVSRTFAAPRHAVFRAWTDPAAIRQWFIEPTGGRWTEEPRVDARPGGEYRLAGESGGKRWCIHGVYREVKPPERLVFTWLWEDHPNPGDSGDTVVTVEFLERGGRTEVVLTHHGFADEAARKDHATGWGECYDAIERFLGRL
ncbi:MAG TPA: SRPBCC family protein [Vicinamibacteria bacterium]|nr:SRPBCC family protein [Vicinamibacteria bacterium]